MTEQWWSVRVELLGGGTSGELWPRPGRVFAVHPRHSLHVLAEAIDDAFARWDRSHLHMFEFPSTGLTATEHRHWDVEDEDRELDADHTRVDEVLTLSASFQYTFDLGDNWRHACQIGPAPIDPAAELGIVPNRPLPYWGWGTIPDPYGRMWDGDDGEQPVPAPPEQPWPWANAPEATHLTMHCPGQ
ncbi:hypothetical protein [Streptomyces sp. NPDC050145]|uniref:IS1096 element passenger TnpR family protein n=1 Tax=Streptomyces sp. NPDC050145 TaxID=3365602 RepID=UPI003798F630